MLRKPLALIRRIASMSPDEIRSRVGVVFRQRLDARRALRGANPLAPGYVRNPPAVTPRFFFDASAKNDLAREVRARLPQEARSVVESADRVQAGSFDLLGYQGLSFGSGEIDWHLDAVHGVRAPLLPWFRVPYLNFRRTGDHKITWELNRHQHLMLLARAWLYTGDASYLRTIESLWFHWQAANPYPFGINWASTLEVAFRCLSWMWVDHWIEDAPEVSDDFRAYLRQGIGESATYIESYLSTYFAANTHLLGEALALLLAGTLYPEFLPAARWRDAGWRILLQESDRQVRGDGFHFEQSVYYHVYALDMFLHARLIASRNGIDVPRSYDDVMVRMADGLAAIAAGGQAPRFGDDDGGRLFDGRRHRPEHLLDPLATAAVIYGRGDWKALAGGLREETVWLLGVNAIRDFDALAPEPRPLLSRAFPESGYYVLAANKAAAVVDAGPHGWGRGGHGHADALSLQLMADGTAWLTDPGTCSYPMAKPERNRFRGTAAHNTLEVDGANQAEPFHSFGWEAHPDVHAERWTAARRVTVFQGWHNGYARLPQPVLHHRWVIGWPDRLWLVRDVAAGSGTHDLAVRWHVSPGCTLQHAGDSHWTAVQDGHTLQLCVAADDVWTGHVESAPWSPAYGATVDAPVLRLTGKTALPAECATLVGLQEGRLALHRHEGDGAVAYAYRSGEVQRLLVFALTGAHWKFQELEDDAELLGVEVRSGAVTHVFRCGGVAGDSEWIAEDGGTPPVPEPALRSLLRVWERL